MTFPGQVKLKSFVHPRAKYAVKRISYDEHRAFPSTTNL
jgi:hypothetical protein